MSIAVARVSTVVSENFHEVRSGRLRCRADLRILWSDPAYIYALYAIPRQKWGQLDSHCKLIGIEAIYNMSHYQFTQENMAV